MNLRKDKRSLHVAVALDKSGSMGDIQKAMLTELNENIQDLRSKADKLDITFSMVQFSGHDSITVTHKAVPITEVKDLTMDDYVVEGLTAMYDGVATALNTVKNNTVDEENTTYMAIIISDGAENNSKEYDSEKVSAMIKERQDSKKWTVIYLGADHDLTQVQQNLGLNAGNMAYFNKSDQGMLRMSSATRSSRTTYLDNLSTGGMVGQSVNYFSDGSDAGIVNLSEDDVTSDNSPII
jgi:uncharacterized protein YegL